MRWTSAITGAALAIALAGTAQAGNVVASDPNTFMAFFGNEGIPAKLTEDSYGDPEIEIRYYGTKFSIYFYGCTDNKDCNAIQFFSGYQVNSEISNDQVNEWNADHRYTFAFNAENGAVRLEYDIYMGEKGMDENDFSEMFSIWTRRLEDFEDFIEW